MKSLRRILSYMRPYRLIVVLGILTTILPVAMELVVPRMLQYVIDSGIRQRDMDAVVVGALVMIGAAAVSAVATIGQGLCRAHLSQGMAFDMRNDLFSHIQALPFATLDQLRTGGLMTRIASDVDVIRMFSSNGLALLLRSLLMITGSTIIVILTDWQLSIIMIICLAITGFVIWNFIRMSSHLFTFVQQKLARLNTVIQENLAGRHVVKAFVRERYEVDRFEDRNVDYMNQNIQVGRILSLVMPILTVVTNVGLVGVIWFGGLDVMGGRLSIGELIAFNNYLMIGMTPLLLLGNMATMASRAEASAERVLELLNTAPLPQVENRYRPAQMKGHITFDNVSFRYASSNGNGASLRDNATDANGDQRKAVLDGVSFEAHPGERVALLGVTGSGKSTLVSLITRFYDVTGGHVRVDGVDVRDWDAEALRGQIGTVLQQTTLFSGTVRENIAYGRPDASLDEVIEAAKSAQAHDFIMAMPQGYDSVVEARGANLSGGQKQRVAIARALLVKPRILIFDDSTSAVDLETEVKIQDALDAHMADTTSLIIAQRINSVINADKIIILDGGHVSAVGNHQELMAVSPIYQEIYRSQFGQETDAPITTIEN